MRFTEINPFGVYVAPTSSTDSCRLGGDDRTALVRRPFWPDAIRSPRAIGAALRLRRRRRRVSMINPVISAAYGRSREVLWRLPDRRAILRRLPFVSRRFQCEWQLPARLAHFMRADEGLLNELIAAPPETGPHFVLDQSSTCSEMLSASSTSMPR